MFMVDVIKLNALAETQKLIHNFVLIFCLLIVEDAVNGTHAHVCTLVTTRIIFSEGIRVLHHVRFGFCRQWIFDYVIGDDVIARSWGLKLMAAIPQGIPWLCLQF